jgi:2-octaprenyl-6-methoxyphenol hydroxylase
MKQTLAIVGGGPTGMALALALKQQGIGAEIFEARARAAVKNDARILALSHGARQILEWLGVWPQIAATPIQTIHVSHRGGLGRTRMQAEDLKVPALGYVMRATDLIAALDAAVEREGLVYREQQKVGAGNTALDGYALTAWAEGAVDAEAATMRDYGQHAVLCTVSTANPHQNVAWERFTPDGPVALLPLGKEYAVVFTVASSDVDFILAHDDKHFLDVLQQRFGERHRFTAATARVAYPLGLRWRQQPVGERQVWLGNAAQTLHPVAGQGFNLALRDIWELAQCLGSAVDDLGAPASLTTYAQGRQRDRRGAITFTNILIDAFANDFPPLKAARGAGLLALDLLPPLRDFVARRMMFGARVWP